MHDRKSLIPTMLGLIGSLLRDFIARTTSYTQKDLERDFATISKRTTCEGLPFLTKTLPTLSKHVIRALETGTFEPVSSLKRKPGTRLPAMFSGLLQCIFQKDGRLLLDPDPDAILCIQQIGHLFYKLELPFSEEQEAKGLNTFLAIEQDLLNLELHESVHHYLASARSLLKDVFIGFNPKDINPKHGPGAVATGERFEDKWTFKRRYKNIEGYYNDPRYYFASHRHFTERRGQWNRMFTLSEGVSRLAFVPKDSRGPRSIAMEPLEYQYMQQGLGRKIMDHCEQADTPVKGYVNFSDQSVNRKLALKHSLEKGYATLDMKEASDRVSLKLVRCLFSESGLLDALESLRTRLCATKLGVVNQSKFAAMGSCLCFPIEGLTFWALAESIRREWRIKGHIYVFGDDLIVPKPLVKYLFEYFPMFGLRFNEDKCFINGAFRESCGMDAFNGIQVTPTRIKHTWPCPKRRRSNMSSFHSTIETANRLFIDGWWHCADHMVTLLKDLYPFLRKLPYTSVRTDFGGISWKTFSGDDYSNCRTRTNVDTQAPEVFCVGYHTHMKASALDDYERLFYATVSPAKAEVKVHETKGVLVKKDDPWKRRVPVLQAGSKPVMVLNKGWYPIWGIPHPETAFDRMTAFYAEKGRPSR